MSKHNPYRDNPNRTACEALIYDQAYERAFRDIIDLLKRWENRPLKHEDFIAELLALDSGLTQEDLRL